MHYLFFIKCFLVGTSAISPVGPIFLLTFNNGAVYGFGRGIATAIGAAIGDSILFFLGLMGTLSVLQSSKNSLFLIDLVGGFLLLFCGISMIMSKKTPKKTIEPSQSSLVLTGIHSFISTIMNPLTLLFFMFMGAQVLPTTEVLALRTLVIGSCFTMIGSCTILTTVAYVSSKIGNVLNFKTLRLISYATGLGIIAIGLYFFIDAFRCLIK